MPYSLVFVLLVLSMGAAAQPLEGPFTVYTAPETATLSTPHMISQITGNARLFFVQHIAGSGSTLYSGEYLFETHQAPNLLPGLTGGTIRVTDAMRDWEEEWFATVTEESDSARAYFIARRGSYRIFADEWHGHPWYGGSHMTDCRLSPRYGGGAVVTAQVETSWGWEGDTWAFTYLFPSYEALPDWEYGFMPNGNLYNSSGYRAVSYARDSVALLTQGYQGSAWWFLPTSDSLPPQVPLDCRGGLEMNRQLYPPLRALIRDSLLRCVEPTLDGSCLELGSQPISDRTILATEWHPHLGYAVLLADGATLSLARMDTNGQTVQAEAVFQRVDTNFRVNDGGLMLLNNTVYVVWCERAYRQPGIARLQIASVGWNTHLGASDPRLNPQPSAVGLSACPNPFNGELEIQFELPRVQSIELSVFNLQGQKVATLFEGVRNAGPHSVTWSPRCGTGVYFVRLKTAEAVRTAKVAYLR